MNELAKTQEAGQQVELPEDFLANLGGLAVTDTDSQKQIEDIIAESEEPEEQAEQSDSGAEAQEKDAPELATDGGGSSLKPPTDNPNKGAAEMPDEPENSHESEAHEDIFEMLGAKAGSYKDHVVEAVGVIAARGEHEGDLSTSELTRVFDPSFTKDGRYHTNYKLLGKMQDQGLVEFELDAIPNKRGRYSDRIIATDKLQEIVESDPKLRTSKKFYKIGKEAGLKSRQEILSFLVDNHQNPETPTSENEE